MEKTTQMAMSQQAAHYTPFTFSEQSADESALLLTRLFRNFQGSILLRLWNGSTLRLGKACQAGTRDAFTLIFHNPRVVRMIVLGRDRLRLAEAYFRGDIDFEGDFFAALGLKDHLNTIVLSPLDKLQALFGALRMDASQLLSTPSGGAPPSLHAQTVKAHSKSENSDAIRFHYDVSNAFYALWLDEAMVYSCAYFEQPDMSLEQAQVAKLDHICRKLQLRYGDHC